MVSTPTADRNPIHILHVEDSRDDAHLVWVALAREGIACEIELVETQAEYEAALARRNFDVVLSDNKLPGFDGLTALRLLRERDQLVPMILVSGSLGEEAAIERIRAGVTDYVLKDRLSRLPGCVRRALAEVDERRRRQQLEAHFLQAQKMDAIGRLSAGIAHDFNNLLTSVLGHTELLLDEMSPEDPRRRDLETIKYAGQQGAALTKQLLALSRQQTLELAVVDADEVARSVERLLARVIGEDITMSVASEPGVGHIRADRAQLEHVLMNLAVNARDAMPRGGRLTIETSSVWIDEHFVARHPDARIGQHIMVAVSDTGDGMAPDVRARIFEPFFTTKARGTGTGLGLAAVYGIVKQFGGSIDVFSEVGRGTTFKMFFPSIDEAVTERREPAFAAPAKRGATILVVEDDELLRSLTKRALGNRGYRLLEAENGEQALEMMAAHDPAPDLLLTDAVLPGISGQELAVQLRAKWPDLPVLFVSGYSRETTVGPLAGTQAFLQKPFTPAALAQKVGEILQPDPPR